jgi:pimeloyl-ACP methyl ester carboxylesterase
MTLRISALDANGLTFAYLHTDEVDDRARPLAVCMHGFPDSAHTYRYLLPELASAGYRPIAPFMRGYAPTQVPSDGRYQTAALGLDANAFHDALHGDERAVIIGHDWGAPAVYGAANTKPDRWSKVVGMAVPPGGVMAHAMFNTAQIKRSWYMFFFQHGLSDMVLPLNDLAFIDMLWADWSPGFDATEDLVHVKNALRDTPNLTAALGYYRATLGNGFNDPELSAAQTATGNILAQPTLYLHGRNDGCVGVEFSDNAASMMSHSSSRVEVVDNAGHFLQLEQPAVVNRLIVEFLQS